jgi:hypothetical protein
MSTPKKHKKAEAETTLREVLPQLPELLVGLRKSIFHLHRSTQLEEAEVQARQVVLDKCKIQREEMEREVEQLRLQREEMVREHKLLMEARKRHHEEDLSFYETKRSKRKLNVPHTARPSSPSPASFFRKLSKESTDDIGSVSAFQSLLDSDSEDEMKVILNDETPL